MIKAEFFGKDGALSGFRVSGHADYDDEGLDIVCAAVTSAVELTANAITEIIGAKADVKVKENEVTLKLKAVDQQSQSFLEALKLHLQNLAESYPENIMLKFTEE